MSEPEGFEHADATGRFDADLAGLARAAQSAARVKPVDQIYRSSAQRARRRRATGTVLSVAVIGAAVFGGVELIPARQTGAVATVPTSTASAQATATADGTATGTQSTTALPRIAGGPAHYAASAWLTPGQLPFATSMGFTKNTNGLGTPLGGAFEVSAADFKDAEQFTCNVNGEVSLNVTGIQDDSFNDAHEDSTLNNQGTGQTIFFFPSAVAAVTGWQQIVHAYQICSAHIDGTINPTTGLPQKYTVTQPISTADTSVWNTIESYPTGACAQGCSQLHEYFVLSGNMIDYLGISMVRNPGQGAADYSSYDSTVIQTMEDGLTAAYSNG